LRAETRALHEEAEALVTFVEAAPTPATYRAYLEQMLGFHEPVEALLRSHAGLRAAGYDARERGRAHLAAADLRALGLSEPALARLPRCAALPALPTAGDALGCAYVVEGSTLGGPFLLRQLRPHLGYLEGQATAFLEGYGARTAARWRELCALLAAAPTDSADEVVRGARDTFHAIADWLRLRRAA
jgi:heme oxygenase